MGTNLHVSKRPIFLFDHRIFQTWDFDTFLIKVPGFWRGRPTKWSVKKVEKIQKIEKKFFFKKWSQCIFMYPGWFRSRLRLRKNFLALFDRLGLLTLFISDPYCQCGKHHWVSGKSKIVQKFFVSNLSSDESYLKYGGPWDVSDTHRMLLEHVILRSIINSSHT